MLETVHEHCGQLACPEFQCAEFLTQNYHCHSYVDRNKHASHTLYLADEAYNTDNIASCDSRCHLLHLFLCVRYYLSFKKLEYLLLFMKIH